MGDLSWRGAFHAALSLLAVLAVLGVAAGDTLHGRTR